ncbi:MAG TPA: hypothetical protein VFR88_11430 [Microlunatus sp.]|nr:hypothetical protein [Microlunatus sp.]
MIELPGWRSGRKISPRPVRGPELVGHREHGKGQFNDDQPPVGGPDGDPST